MLEQIPWWIWNFTLFSLWARNLFLFHEWNTHNRHVGRVLFSGKHYTCDCHEITLWYKSHVLTLKTASSFIRDLSSFSRGTRSLFSLDSTKNPWNNWYIVKQTITTCYKRNNCILCPDTSSVLDYLYRYYTCNSICKLAQNNQSSVQNDVVIIKVAQTVCNTKATRVVTESCYVQ